LPFAAGGLSFASWLAAAVPPAQHGALDLPGRGLRQRRDDDTDQLDRRLRRAVTATTVEDVIRD